MFKNYQPKKGYDEYFSSEDSLPRSSLEPLLSSLGEMGLDQLNISHGIARKLLLRHGATFRLNDSGNRGSERILPFYPLPRVIGSCRDLAILLMETCRCVGIPSRFVSGYQFMEQPPDKYELHAWTEVFIPDFGWRGFDPSGSGLINHNYIALASSSKSELVAPVRGSFVGPSKLKSELKWNIEIT